MLYFKSQQTTLTHHYHIRPLQVATASADQVDRYPILNSYFIKLTKTTTLRCSIKKAVLKKFAIFTGKRLCWSLFVSFIKKRLQNRCFTLTKFFRTLWKTSELKHGCFWDDFRKWLFGNLFLDGRFQNQPDSVDIFHFLERPCNLRYDSTLQRQQNRSVYFEAESISSLLPKIWQSVSWEIKIANSLDIFKEKIKF